MNLKKNLNDSRVPAKLLDAVTSDIFARSSLSLTPCFSRVFCDRRRRANRFNGFLTVACESRASRPATRKPLKRFSEFCCRPRSPG